VTSSSDHPLRAFGAVGELLLRTLAAERLSPSYLFEGADRDALHAAARAFAAGILAGAPPAAPDERVFRLAREGTHPDLHELGQDKATVISVAALAPVLARAHSTPIESAHQVFLIDPAEAMEPEGIARYLKSLEEPPAGTVFVLVTTRAERLPETVLSRCRRVRFAPLAVEQVAAHLEADGVERGDARRTAQCAGGSLARARRLAEHGIVTVAAALVEAALQDEPRVAEAAERALAQLQQGAAELAARDARETDTKRQYLRVLLRDVLRTLCAHARECAASRNGGPLPALEAERALDLIATWGGLETAVVANVTPAAILIETMAALRRLRHDPAHVVR
jgi:DNA polymerase-3 subunit delta'